MVENKTKPENTSVESFLNKIKDEAKRNDCFRIMKIMERITKKPAVMWGTSIIGFGSYHYKYESGREGDMCLIGFSPRAQNISIYLMGCVDRHPELMKKLGKYKTGNGCLYIKKLEDVDLKTLEELIKTSIKYLKTLYPAS